MIIKFPYECSLPCSYFTVYETEDRVLGENRDFEYMCNRYNLHVCGTEMLMPSILIDCYRWGKDK